MVSMIGAQTTKNIKSVCKPADQLKQAEREREEEVEAPALTLKEIYQ